LQQISRSEFHYLADYKEIIFYTLSRLKAQKGEGMRTA